LSDEVRVAVNVTIDAVDVPVRLTMVLRHLEIPASSWYRKQTPPQEPRRRGPAPKPISEEIVKAVVKMARENPWYGYKRIAVMCRREGTPVKNREAYLVMKNHNLLQKRRPLEPELHQTAKLFDLLPCGPNELWQMDVTYIHIPGYGWRYAVTVIDYYSRYLLACHLTSSYCAFEVTNALSLARAEAERLHGKITKAPYLVTDNGPSFLARRFATFVAGHFAHRRIRYRTPTQLGLLERFHKTLKEEEVYWRTYDDIAHARRCLDEFRKRYNERRPHWALVPAERGDPLVPIEVYKHGRAVEIPRWQAWAKRAKSKLEKLMGVA